MSMDRPLCGMCARPLTDMAHLCLHCTRSLRRDLLALPALIADVQVTASRQAKLGDRGRPGGSKPLPVELDAADVVFHAWNLLGTWARDVAETTGDRPPWEQESS